MPDFCEAVREIVADDTFLHEDAFKVSQVVEQYAALHSAWFSNSLDDEGRSRIEHWALGTDRCALPFHLVKGLAAGNGFHGLWDKLRSMDYHAFLKTNYWLVVKNQILEIAEYRCRLCNNENNLHVHHRSYYHRGHELYFLEDMIALCADCHDLFHANRKLVVIASR